MKKIYLVEDTGNAPGRIYACFANRKDAENFATYFESVDVVERSVIYGQPLHCGYNP